MRRPHARLFAAVLVAVLLATACSASGDGVPDRPDVPDGPLDESTRANLDDLFEDPSFLTRGDLGALGESGDVRVAWPLVDLARFHQGPDTAFRVIEPLEALTGVEPDDDGIAWVAFADALFGWDVPAPPGYLDWKRKVYLEADPTWEPFFDEAADLDWREVTWGGVFRDGIEALTDPPVAESDEGEYLAHDEVVFGVVVGDEARAYPRRHLVVHELVNDTVGGRRVALPFCTLCGSVVGYFLDRPPAGLGTLELKTSGLLLRSNKLMYDAGSESLFHQFLGTALSGPHAEAGTTLPRLTVVTTTWGRWREEHPDTTVLSQDAGTGRDYEREALGRGDESDRPVFPVGAVDERLAAKTRVFGVATPEGAAVAFVADDARELLRADREVSAFGVELRLEAGGLVASAGDGPDLVGHEAFWFAWSQFRPDTRLWQATGTG